MNEEADTTEVVEAIERLRRGYQKPLYPTPNPPDQHTGNDGDEAHRRDPTP
jgi:hypothetical protein